MQMGTNDCFLTAMAHLSRDSLLQEQLSWYTKQSLQTRATNKQTVVLVVKHAVVSFGVLSLQRKCINTAVNALHTSPAKE